MKSVAPWLSTGEDAFRVTPMQPGRPIGVPGCFDDGRYQHRAVAGNDDAGLCLTSGAGFKPVLSLAFVQHTEW